MPYVDIAKQREYQRVWTVNRRATYLADKYCVICGSTTNLRMPLY